MSVCVWVCGCLCVYVCVCVWVHKNNPNEIRPLIGATLDNKVTDKPTLCNAYLDNSAVDITTLDVFCRTSFIIRSAIQLSGVIYRREK